MVLTVVGSAVAMLAVTNRDRDTPAGSASWCWEPRPPCGCVGVAAPELYTLPAAALLIGAGLWRLHPDPASTA